MDAIEDLQKLQGAERAETQIQPRRVDRTQKQDSKIPEVMRRAIQRDFRARK
jgi:hypothetical protein